MDEVILKIVYEALIGVVPASIAIMIPFLGAFWIFKIREKTVSEGKIFEIGREIASILQMKKFVGLLMVLDIHTLIRHCMRVLKKIVVQH